MYLLLVAESENGYRLGRDWLYDRKISVPKKAVGDLVKKVVRDLSEDIDSDACVDEYMRDQVVLFQALAEGSSIVKGGWVGESSRVGTNAPYDHTRTAEWVAREILGVRFNSDGVCKGIGLKAGNDDQE